MPQTLVELGGAVDQPIMHIATANGFPPQVYLPMLRAWMADYRALCFPPRALWGDEMPPGGYQDWGLLADDLLAGLAAHDMGGITALGHSLGAIASLLAVIKEPQRFRALILLDPVILLPKLLEQVRQAWRRGNVEQLPLVAGAKRRRRFFDSREDAFVHFRAKRLFADWSDEVLRLYVEHGTQARAGQAGFELCWSAEWEAYYFATVYLKIWEALPKLEGTVPLLFVRGADSDAFVREAFDRVKRMAASAAFYEMAGQGHLFPQAAPQATWRVIQAWLESELASSGAL